MRYEKIENPQGIQGNFVMDKKKGLIIPERLKKRNKFAYAMAVPLTTLLLTGCPDPISIPDHNVSLNSFEQNGRYVVLDIGFDDKIQGNNATLNAKIDLQNAQNPTQEALDLYGLANNDTNGNITLSESGSKALIYVPNPGDTIKALVEAQGRIYSLEQLTNTSIEKIEVDDGFYEKVRRKLITTPYFNYTTGVHIPSEGISINSGVLTEGALRGVGTIPDIGSAENLDITKPNDYTFFNLSASDVENFRSRLTSFMNDYWINSLDTKKMDANIQFGTFVSLEQYLNGTYTGAPFNFRNTYINENVNLEYKINIDDPEEFNLSIRDGYNFTLYYEKNGNIYTPSIIYFTNENNVFNRYEFDDSQKLWIKKVGEYSNKYKSIENIVPEEYLDSYNRIQNTINNLNN